MRFAFATLLTAFFACPLKAQVVETVPSDVYDVPVNAGNAGVNPVSIVPAADPGFSPFLGIRPIPTAPPYRAVPLVDRAIPVLPDGPIARVADARAPLAISPLQAANFKAIPSVQLTISPLSAVKGLRLMGEQPVIGPTAESASVGKAVAAGRAAWDGGAAFIPSDPDDPTDQDQLVARSPLPAVAQAESPFYAAGPLRSGVLDKAALPQNPALFLPRAPLAKPLEQTQPRLQSQTQVEPPRTIAQTVRSAAASAETGVAAAAQELQTEFVERIELPIRRVVIRTVDAGLDMLIGVQSERTETATDFSPSGRSVIAFSAAQIGEAQGVFDIADEATLTVLPRPQERDLGLKPSPGLGSEALELWASVRSGLSPAAARRIASIKFPPLPRYAPVSRGAQAASLFFSILLPFLLLAPLI